MTRWMHRLSGAAVLALAMLPVLAGADVVLTLGFSSPATNAGPGASFTGQIGYSPTGTVITATVTSGTGIVPQTNLSLSVGTNTAEVTLVPLANTSGQVDVDVTGVQAASTNTVSFSVVFQPYPPTISAITNRGRNRELVLGYINSDVDRCMGFRHVVLHRKRTATCRPAIRIQPDPSWPGR